VSKVYGTKGKKKNEREKKNKRKKKQRTPATIKNVIMTKGFVTRRD